MIFRLLISLAGLALMGCATNNVQTRITERNAAFAALPADVRASVEAGQI